MLMNDCNLKDVDERILNFRIKQKMFSIPSLDYSVSELLIISCCHKNGEDASLKCSSLQHIASAFSASFLDHFQGEISSQAYKQHSYHSVVSSSLRFSKATGEPQELLNIIQVS
ncbi:hypothetical protein T4B_2944 [Trichinella pseudospiralis]|uniref:Uncharacterized protein n=1 Tax=Trichinella pseudospiralis TaxID=6337 RepID=A0A0V1IMU5_TRIPS|nr:hypothetical protein T4B_2944 [Trichinella pseudospiralis]